jgi:autotransporter-associated beta strand protein
MSHSPRAHRRHCAIIQITTFTAAALLAHHAPAATVSWDGGGGNVNWSTAANWSTNTIPADTDDLVFNTGLTSNSVIALGTARTASSLTFNTGTSFSIGTTGSPNLTLTSGTVNSNSSAGYQNVGTNLYTAAGAGWAITATGAGTLEFTSLYQTDSATHNIALYGNNVSNVYIGTTNIAGVVNVFGPNLLMANNTLPDIHVNSGSVEMDTYSATQNLFIAGTGNGGGALRCNQGEAAFNNLTLTAAATANLSVELDCKGSLSDGGHGYTLTEAGTATLGLFAAANNFTGTVNINSGTIAVHNSSALGSTTSVVNVAAAGTLELDNASVTKSVFLASGATLSSYSFVGEYGTLNGTLSLSGPASLSAQKSSLLIHSNIVESGSAAGSFNVSTYFGSVILDGNNSFRGGITVSSGTLTLGSNTAAGSGTVTATADDTVVALTNSVTVPNAITGISFSSVSGVNNIFAGTLTLYNDATFNAAPGSSFTVTGHITDSPFAADLNKTGTTRILLANSNTYEGATNITAGTLAISNSAALPATGTTTVSPGATLELLGNISPVAPLNLNGSGTSAVGALRSTAGFNTYAGAITLTADAAVGVDAGSTLTLSHAIGDAGSNSALTKVGFGTLVLSAANTYTGGTTVAAGTLLLTADNQLGSAANPLSITNSATLELTASFSTARTINANNGFLLADPGVTITYSNATITGGNLRGTGTHAIAAGSIFISSTSITGSTVTQTGPASLINFTNGGTLTNASPLTWTIGSNTSSGILNVNSILATSNFINYGVLNVASGATLTNSITSFTAAAGSRTTVASGGTISLTSSQPLNLSSLLTNNGTITGAPINVYYGGLATGTGSWPAVNLSAGATFSPGGVQSPPTPNFATTAYIQPTPGNQSVAAPVTLLADTIADVTNSSDSLTLTSQLTASGITLTKIHPGTLSLTNLRAAALVATDGTLAILPAHTSSATSSLSSLTITGTGHFDLADNNLVLDYTASSPLTQIRQYLQTGALTSSSATNNSNHTTALGYAEASQLSPTTAAQIAGTLPYDSTTLLIKYTYEGDANLDGKITADDYALLDKGFATHASTWTLGDFNYDGVVNAVDYLLIDKTVTLQSGSYSPDATLLAQREAQFGDAYVSELLTSIPEPSLLAACGLAFPLLRRRRPQ